MLITIHICNSKQGRQWDNHILSFALILMEVRSQLDLSPSTPQRRETFWTAKALDFSYFKAHVRVHLFNSLRPLIRRMHRVQSTSVDRRLLPKAMLSLFQTLFVLLFCLPSQVITAAYPTQKPPSPTTISCFTSAPSTTSTQERSADMSGFGVINVGPWWMGRDLWVGVLHCHTVLEGWDFEDWRGFVRLSERLRRLASAQHRNVRVTPDSPQRPPFEYWLTPRGLENAISQYFNVLNRKLIS